MTIIYCKTPLSVRSYRPMETGSRLIPHKVLKKLPGDFSMPVRIF